MKSAKTKNPTQKLHALAEARKLRMNLTVENHGCHISNLAVMGQVAELDAARARVRVKAGSILTIWLPFATGRAGKNRTWHAPEPGEQVLVVAPCGDLNQGIVVGSAYQAAYPSPADSANISRTIYKEQCSFMLR